MGTPLDQRTLELLKLCGGKQKNGQIISILEDEGWHREEVLTRLADFEQRKWILFTEI